MKKTIMSKLVSAAVLTGLALVGTTHAVNKQEVAADPVVGSSITAKVVKPGTSGSTAPVPNTYTDLDCGGGRKLRLTVEGGSCSVSASNGVGVCRNNNGDYLLDASCASGCGNDPSLQARCTQVMVR